MLTKKEALAITEDARNKDDNAEKELAEEMFDKHVDFIDLAISIISKYEKSMYYKFVFFKYNYYLRNNLRIHFESLGYIVTEINNGLEFCWRKQC